MKAKLLGVVGLAVIVAALLPRTVFASPFGQGVFGADVPYGSATSISISVGSDVSIPLTFDGTNFTGNGSHVVTVTSTDVVGYDLYAHGTTTTNMSNGAATIAASANGTATTLAVGTWGYNITGSASNFLGLPTGGALIKHGTGPFKSGDATTVTYGVVAGPTQPSGSYSIAMTYTVVAVNP